MCGAACAGLPLYGRTGYVQVTSTMPAWMLSCRPSEELPTGSHSLCT
jgi:hypothetical protein